MWRHYHRRVLDDNNEMVEELSLEHLMSGCTDFINEVSQLEYVCEQLGVRALFTTKYHAEMAGEGVEYSWAHSKNLYRRTALRVKKGKSNFDSTMEYCISREVLPTELIRKFSKRARAYMLAYKALEFSECQMNTQSPHIISHERIERMMASFKTHRSAMDFDKNFVLKCYCASDLALGKRKREEKHNGDM